jgi:hypothetical protein
MVLGQTAFVFTYASYVPYMDDWEWVPAVTGEQPVDLPWLWAQVNDHRLPLGKLLLVGLYTVSGGDFRAGMYANVLCLAVLAFVTLRVTRSLRGWTSYWDVIIPLALLNIDKEIIFLGLGVNTVPAMVLAGFMLLVIVQQGTRPALGTFLLAGSCLVLLALIGTIGLALVPALALWLVYVGGVCWRTGHAHGKRHALLAWAFAALGFVLVPLYFVDFIPYDQAPPSPGLPASVRTTLEYLSMSFGQAGDLGLPPSAPPFVGLVVLGLALGSVVPLIRAWRRQPPQRPRALGLLLYLLAMGSLAFGVGMARSGGGLGAGYQPRYVLLATPVLCCLYFVWQLYGAPSTRRLVIAILLAPLIVLFPLNVKQTLECGREHGRHMAEVEQVIEAGGEPTTIAADHGRFLYDQVPTNQMAQYLDMLRRAAIGPFQQLQAYVPPEPASIEVVPLDVAAARAHQMTWENGAGIVQGPESYLLFTLPKPESVRGIRICYDVTQVAGPASLQIYWRRSVQNDFGGGKRQARLNVKTGRGEQTKTIVVNDTIDQIRVHPSDRPCRLKILELAMLTPAAENTYDVRVQEIRQLAPRILPPGARVSVVGRDKALLRLNGLRASRFPQDEDGVYLGNPEDSAQAIAYLKAARARAEQFLLFPGIETWWLEEYREFKKYLDAHSRPMHRGDACVIYDLR